MLWFENCVRRTWNEVKTIDRIVTNYLQRITHTGIIACAIVSDHDGIFACVNVCVTPVSVAL